MPNFNKVILAGHLTRDPQLTTTQGGVTICKFGLATSHKWKDKAGETRDEVCFVDCTLFGKSGETFNQYMAKGRPVLIEGRLQLNQWTTEAGEKKSKLSVLVDKFQFLGSKGDGQSAERPAAARHDDDIPF